MAVTFSSARFLVEARGRGARFDRTLMLGHQALFANPVRLYRLLSRSGAFADAAAGQAFLDGIRHGGYADPLFRALGATTVDAMDASPYENAQIIHDLNEPLPDDLRGRYSLVFDGGTLEHVFNLPVALANAMELVEPGGHLVSYTPVNNNFGHGFYQFSPELFFRALSPDNGFEVERMVIFTSETVPRKLAGIPYVYERTGRFHEVRDPRVHRGRHALINDKPVEVLVLARRTADVRPFAAWPQQSDYAATWDESAPAGGAGETPFEAPAPVEVAAAPAVRAVTAVRDHLPGRWLPLASAGAIAGLTAVMRPVDAVRIRVWNRRNATLSNRRMYPPAD